jgi:hypothetical protein
MYTKLFKFFLINNKFNIGVVTYSTNLKFDKK